MYSNVGREHPPPEPERPRKSRRGAPLRRQPSTDVDDDEPPPVPEKDPELLREITDNAQTTQSQTQPLLVKPVPKKRKNVPNQKDDKPNESKTEEGRYPTTPSIDNPFYDGVIILQPPPKGRAGSKSDAESRTASANGPAKKLKAKPMKISAKMSGPTRFGEYELASAVPGLDDTIGIEEQSETESEPLSDTAQVGKRRREKHAHKTTESHKMREPMSKGAKPKKAASTEEGPLGSIIVDKYFYNFIWTFKGDEVAWIQDGCRLVTEEVGGQSKRDIEVRFKPKNTSISIAESEERFMEIYKRLEQSLVVENVNVSQVKDVREMQNELENIFETLCFNVNEKQMDIVCERKNQKSIKRCITKHGGLPIVGAPQLHSNPNIAGRSSKPGKSPSTEYSAVSYNLNNAFKLHIYQADITKLNVDAVVNAANGFLRHGSGIARAILKAAGPQLDKEGKEILQQRKEIPVSHVVRTTAGQMPSKMVLHAVGPRWPSKNDRTAQARCIEALIATFENVIAAANENGVRSIAMPPISSGVFAVPKESVAWGIHTALVNASSRKTSDPRWTIDEVHVVDIVDPILTELKRLFSETTNFETRNGKMVAVEEIAASTKPEVAEVVPTVTSRGPPLLGAQPAATARRLERPVGFTLGLAYNVYIYNADITKLNVDAVINSANVEMSFESGVARSISNAAGGELAKASQEIMRKRKRLNVAEVLKTPSGNMPCKMILHAVAPVWPAERQDLQEQCLMDLRETFDNVLAAANKYGARSIAIPTISSGGAAVPMEKVAVALHASLVKGADPDTLNPKAKLKEIHVVNVTDPVLVKLAELFGDGGMIRAASGKMVGVMELERQDIKIASNDMHRQLIGAAPVGTLRQKKKKNNFFKNLCGGGSHKEV